MPAFRPPDFMEEGSCFVSTKNDREIGVHDSTGQAMMLDKKERRLLRLLLGMSLKSESAKQYITETLGSRFLKVGEKLLSNMGGEDT
jgi:hypothetical protein